MNDSGGFYFSRNDKCGYDKEINEYSRDHFGISYLIFMVFYFIYFTYHSTLLLITSI